MFPSDDSEQDFLPLESNDFDDSDLDILEGDSPEEDYEVITSDEVDHVLSVLDELIQSAGSENVRSTLEEAAEAIFALVYTEDDAIDLTDGLESNDILEAGDTEAA